MGGLNESRVLNCVPRELRESFAEGCDTLSLHLEVTLLCHSGVPTDQNALVGLLTQ